MTSLADEVTLDVKDAEGARVGQIEDVSLATLARRLPVTLDEDAQEVLDVDEALVDLPAALIQNRGEDELTLSRPLEGIREMLEGPDLEGGLDDL